MNTRAIGIGLMAASLSFYLLSVLSLVPSRTPFYDLVPDPDAPEYFAVASSINSGEGARIHLAGKSYPSRYPPGFSYFMVPFLGFGSSPLDAPYLLNKVAGALLLAWMFGWLWKRGRPLAAGLSALLLATLPAFIALSRSPMSEVVSALFVAIGLSVLWDAVRRQGTGVYIALSGFLLGLSLSIRVANLFLFLALCIAVMAVPADSRRRRLKKSLSFAFGCLVGAIPWLTFNLLSFGTPFTTGYDFWVPQRGPFFSAFQFSYLGQNLSYFWRELVQSETADTMATFYAEGSYFTFVFPLLVVAAIWRSRNNRQVLVFLTCGVLSMIPFLFYFYSDARFIFHQMVLGIPLIGCLSEDFLRASRTRWWWKLALAVLLLCQIADFPGTRLDPDFDRHLRVRRKDGKAYSYKLIQEVVRNTQGDPVLVLTDINQPLVYALLEGERIVAPATKRNGYSYNPAVFRYSDAERGKLIEEALNQERTILLAMRSQTPENPLPVPPPPGYFWEVLIVETHLGVLAILTKGDENMDPAPTL